MLNTLFANYWLVSLIILIIWVGILIFYLSASQQQQVLESELDSLSQLLEEDQNGRSHLD